MAEGWYTWLCGRGNLDGRGPAFQGRRYLCVRGNDAAMLEQLTGMSTEREEGLAARCWRTLSGIPARPVKTVRSWKLFAPGWSVPDLGAIGGAVVRGLTRSLASDNHQGFTLLVIVQRFCGRWPVRIGRALPSSSIDVSPVTFALLHAWARRRYMN